MTRCTRAGPWVGVRRGSAPVAMQIMLLVKVGSSEFCIAHVTHLTILFQIRFKFESQEAECVCSHEVSGAEQEADTKLHQKDMQKSQLEVRLGADVSFFSTLSISFADL